MSKNATRTVSDMINRYVREYLPRHNNTYQRIKIIHLRWWERAIGSYPLSKTRPSLFIKCRNKLLVEKNKQGKIRSPSTINRYFNALSGVFSIAVKEWQWLDSSPMQGMSKLKEPIGRTRCLSKEELHRLLKVCQQSASKDLYPAVVLALSTCARKSEIMSLRWDNIDLKNGVIILEHTKNGMNRAVPLQGYALKLIRSRYNTTSSNQSKLIFPGRLKPSQPINLRRSWENALRLANIEDFRWHDLRHTGASYLAMSGASLTELSDVLGHKTLQMVKRYAHLSLPHTIKIVAKMNKQMFGKINVD